MTPTYLKVTHMTPTYLTETHMTPTYLTMTHMTPTYLTVTHMMPTYLTMTHMTPTYLTVAYMTPTYLTVTHDTHILDRHTWCPHTWQRYDNPYTSFLDQGTYTLDTIRHTQYTCSHISIWHKPNLKPTILANCCLSQKKVMPHTMKPVQKYKDENSFRTQMFTNHLLSTPKPFKKGQQSLRDKSHFIRTFA